MPLLDRIFNWVWRNYKVFQGLPRKIKFKLHKKIPVLMLGRVHPGKTTILYSMQGISDIPDIPPTTGFNVENVQVKSKTLQIWDIGTGNDLIYQSWKCYLTPELQAIIYVIDSTETEDQMEISGLQLHGSLIRYIADNSPIILLIYANKQDLPGCMSIVKIVNLLGLQEIKVRWHIQECSAINGIGIKAGLCWLHNELKKTWNPKIEKFI